MALKVWWNSDADDGVRVESSDELVELLTQVSGTVGYPIMFELVDAENPYAHPILDVGVSGDRGALYFTGPGAEDGCFSWNSSAEATDELVHFDYMNNTREFPQTSLHDLEVVWQVCAEFAENVDERPAVLSWQPRRAVAR
ncbi:Imm1 family immunity protein [Lentzea cavernae]|uniref:Immunity protein Imm1 n=1 Tax=Lentzea cavernae TaxID=2020703 RepID=A0ABQ3M8F7_9PSEU|nr:Imm1 family immunity protein [Lentzea cavernae]GHH35578.1 hypothetical protein GCM10017774_21030 [Lentzea cavernae]